MRIDNTKENGRRGSVHLTETPLPLHPGKHQDLKALLRYMCWVHVFIVTSQLSSQSKDFPVVNRKVQFVFSKKGLGWEKLLSQCKKKKYSRQILSTDGDTLK